MPDLLLELRSEEIPARMQRKAAGDLRRMVADGLVEAGLTYEGAKEYWTPRRLALDIRGVTARSRDVSEEIRGPSTKAPEQAVQGFLRKAGLSSVAEAKIQSDPKKGDFYIAVISKPGRAAEEIIAELMPRVIRDFPWPKSMRWGAASARPGSLRWVRPLQSILCTFGPETEEPVVVGFEVDGLRSGNVTVGHRFHAPGEIAVKRFDDYVAKLEKAKVMLDAERRKRVIHDDAKNLAFASGLELVEDEGLLEEVSGLVEWPVVLMGEFEEEFLEIPAEVVRLTIRANQKCFVTRPIDGCAESPSPPAGPSPREHGEKEDGRDADAPLSPSVRGEGKGEGRRHAEGGASLSNRFLITANIEAKDGGAEVARGNGKVVRARLSDALYFWNADQADLPDLDRLKPSAEKFGLDLAKPLDQRMARLDHLGVTFHAKLGTQGERVERIRRLAEEIAPVVGAEPSTAARAAVLAKADLTSEIVGEFPELQGAMGRKYAVLQGEHPSVAAAIEEHYKPQGPSDVVPAGPVSIAVALAEKLDTLVGFWAIDEKPTGSKDPYALRRAALGVIRIVVENGVRLPLLTVFQQAGAILAHNRWAVPVQRQVELTTEESLGTLQPDGAEELTGLRRRDLIEDPQGFDAGSIAAAIVDLLSFFHDRLKVYLRDKGARHDLIDAVLASGGAGDEGHGPNDDLLMIVRRVEALSALLDTEEGRNLLAGAKRSANILAAEEKKGTAIAVAVDPALLREDAERGLFQAVNEAEARAAGAIGKEDFAEAMRALGALRGPIDLFFDKVLVNDEDARVRANRLALLKRIRAATGQVADFSKIAG